MFTSFDETAFWNAINEKDLLRLKVNTVSAMRNDPTFERGETDKVISILEERVPEIFEQERTLEAEERLSRDKWDKGYFTKLTYWFQENFAKSRINHIKEVGKAVHQDTAMKYAQSMAANTQKGDRTTSNSTYQNTAQSVKRENPTRAPGKKKTVQTVGAIAAVAALVLIVVLLIKALSK